MIRGFRDADTEALFDANRVARFAAFERVVKGDRKGQHSIRINLKWRICFVWTDGNANDVEITDYH